MSKEFKVGDYVKIKKEKLESMPSDISCLFKTECIITNVDIWGSLSGMCMGNYIPLYESQPWPSTITSTTISCSTSSIPISYPSSIASTSGVLTITPASSESGFVYVPVVNSAPIFTQTVSFSPTIYQINKIYYSFYEDDLELDVVGKLRHKLNRMKDLLK
jgi:hypothetical protein